MKAGAEDDSDQVSVEASRGHHLSRTTQLLPGYREQAVSNGTSILTSYSQIGNTILSYKPLVMFSQPS